MDRELERYVAAHTEPEDPLLAELERVTALRVEKAQMISGHVQGRTLMALTRMIRPKSVLEIGTYTGYSALCFAAASPQDCVIDTVEVEDEITDIAAEFFGRSPYGHKVRQHVGRALDLVPSLGRRYDMVFIDADKREYPDYYRMLMGDGPFSGSGPLVSSGGWILADNILWYGKVAGVPKEGDRQTRAIQQFNDMVLQDPRTENVIVPVRDGINIIRVL